MREIKFRVWDKRGKRMSDVLKEHEFWFADTSYITIGQALRYPDYILLQYTGLKDKNGKNEVYDGDLFRMDDIDWEIYWDERLTGWCRKNDKGGMHAFYKEHAEKGEVIGNIYES